MDGAPEWLPEMLNVKQPWPKLLQLLYHVFCDDFIMNAPSFEGMRVNYNDRILEQPYPEGFWHLITIDEAGHGRVPDYRRAERLPWCAPVISHCEERCILVWDYLERKEVVRTYIWLDKLDYVVVLQKATAKTWYRVKLITAFHVDGDSRRANLRRKYENRV